VPQVQPLCTNCTCNSNVSSARICLTSPWYSTCRPKLCSQVHPITSFFFFLTLVYVLFIFPTFPLIFNIILSFPNSFLNFLLLFAISHFLETVKVKVKQSLYRPATGPEGPRRLTFSDFKTSAHEGSKVVSPMHQPPLPRRTTHFCLRLSRPQGHSAAGRIMAMKNL